jgi:hypothetical protein
MYRTGNILARSKSRNREALRRMSLNRSSILRWNGHLRLFMLRRFARGYGERIDLRLRVNALRSLEQTLQLLESGDADNPYCAKAWMYNGRRRSLL